MKSSVLKVAMAVVPEIGALVLGAQPSHAQTADVIRVEVSGMRSDKGAIVCSIFASADGYPKKDERAVGRTKGEIRDKQARCDFTGLAPGTYAVSVFHDENGNGKLDTNFIGMPKEGVGASNDAKGHMGPPKFEAAAFKYAGGTLELKITVRYLWPGVEERLLVTRLTPSVE